MEVGQGPNWGCGAKGKIYAIIPEALPLSARRTNMSWLFHRVLSVSHSPFVVLLLLLLFIIILWGLECFIICQLSCLISSASSFSKCHVTFSMPLMTSVTVG
jgi:hypothetical protein